MTRHTPNPLPDLPRPTKAYHKTVYSYVSPDRPELNVAGKTLLITGGAGGIGQGIYKAFAQAGIDRIIIIGRTLSALTALKNELESNFPKLEVTVHAASVTDGVAMHSIIHETGKIDIVVSAAAICHQATPPSTIPPSELSEILQTNTVGPFLLISTILHERAIQGWKHEVNVIYVSSALSHTHMSFVNVCGEQGGYESALFAPQHGVECARGFNLRDSSGFDLYHFDWKSVS